MILASFHIQKNFWKYQTILSKKIQHESTTLIRSLNIVWRILHPAVSPKISSILEIKRLKAILVVYMWHQNYSSANIWAQGQKYLHDPQNRRLSFPIRLRVVWIIGLGSQKVVQKHSKSTLNSPEALQKYSKRTPTVLQKYCKSAPWSTSSNRLLHWFLNPSDNRLSFGLHKRFVTLADSTISWKIIVQ